MEQTLRLVFRNAEGRSVTMSVSDPKDPLDSLDVDNVMDLIINADIFDSSGGNITEKVRAEIVSRQVNTILEF